MAQARCEEDKMAGAALAEIAKYCNGLSSERQTEKKVSQLSDLFFKIHVLLSLEVREKHNFMTIRGRTS